MKQIFVILCDLIVSCDNNTFQVYLLPLLFKNLVHITNRDDDFISTRMNCVYIF